MKSFKQELQQRITDPQEREAPSTVRDIYGPAQFMGNATLNTSERLASGNVLLYALNTPDENSPIVYAVAKIKLWGKKILEPEEEGKPTRKKKSITLLIGGIIDSATLEEHPIAPHHVHEYTGKRIDYCSPEREPPAEQVLSLDALTKDGLKTYALERMTDRLITARITPGKYTVDSLFDRIHTRMGISSTPEDLYNILSEATARPTQGRHHPSPEPKKEDPGYES